MNGNHRNWVLTSALAAGVVACAPEEEDGLSQEQIDAAVDVRFAEEVVVTEELEGDIRKMQRNLAKGYYRVFSDRDGADGLSLRSGVGRIEMTYLGPASMSPPGEPPDSAQEPREPADEKEVLPSQPVTSWDVLDVETMREYRVKVPPGFLESARVHAETTEINRGYEPDPDAPDGESGFRAISGGSDDRTVRGLYNQAQTAVPYKKIASMGVAAPYCSGTLFGPGHVLTAAHCIRNDNGTWISTTYSPGRSGPNAWAAQAQIVASSGSSMWVPTMYRILSDNDGSQDPPLSAREYDIGMFVDLDDSVGYSVGWMGWYWSGSDSSFSSRAHLARAYAACDGDFGIPTPHDPPNCSNRRWALWGQSGYCGEGNFSAYDSDGLSRLFRHDCDVSAAHSGSPLYFYNVNNFPTISAITIWEDGCQSNCSFPRPNAGVKITKEYSGWMSYFRTLGPQ